MADLGEGAEASDSSVEELMPLVYDELRRLARGYLARERRGHTLEPTALVNEAYLRLVDQTHADWRGRSHFFAVGAMMMRRILVDHARRRGSGKRGGDWLRVTLSEELPRGDLDLARLLSLQDALERLSELDERQGRVVELRLFAGLTVEEVAEVLGVSKRTVEGDWKHARVWLARELGQGESQE